MHPDSQPEHYEQKADFSDIYDQGDPRAYFRTLGSLDYAVPAHGTPIFERLLGEMGGREGKTVLDVCCSYGINAALLNHDISLDDLVALYAQFGADSDETEVQRVSADWFAERRRADAVETIGLDAAPHAVEYATKVGLLDRGIVADLESAPPDPKLAQMMAGADLVTVTGGIGYIGARTMRTVVEAAGDEPPWVAALSLRWIGFDPIAEALEDLGLVTEHLDGYCVPQRRFADDGERQAAVTCLEQRGLDAGPELELDSHCAELFVVRPPEAVRDRPIQDLLTGVDA